MKISKILSAVCLFLMITTSSLMAAPSLVLQDGPFQHGSGGEFSAEVTNGTTGLPTGNMFQTFCLETDEYLSYGSTYYFAVNTQAVNGGVGGGSPDPLSSQAAWLYNEFTLGDSGSLDYDFDNSSGQRNSDAGALQNAIWFLEDELATVSGKALTYKNLAINDGWTDDIGDIRVLNLYKTSDLSGNVQDVLAKVTPAAVPAPGALLLSAVGTMCAGYLRKRRTV